MSFMKGLCFFLVGVLVCGLLFSSIYPKSEEEEPFAGIAPKEEPPLPLGGMTLYQYDFNSASFDTTNTTCISSALSNLNYKGVFSQKDGVLYVYDQTWADEGQGWIDLCNAKTADKLIECANYSYITYDFDYKVSDFMLDVEFLPIFRAGLESAHNSVQRMSNYFDYEFRGNQYYNMGTQIAGAKLDEYCDPEGWLHVTVLFDFSQMENGRAAMALYFNGKKVDQKMIYSIRPESKYLTSARFVVNFDDDDDDAAFMAVDNFVMRGFEKGYTGAISRLTNVDLTLQHCSDAWMFWNPTTYKINTGSALGRPNEGAEFYNEETKTILLNENIGVSYVSYYYNLNGNYVFLFDDKFDRNYLTSIPEGLNNLLGAGSVWFGVSGSPGCDEIFGQALHPVFCHHGSHVPAFYVPN